MEQSLKKAPSAVRAVWLRRAILSGTLVCALVTFLCFGSFLLCLILYGGRMSEAVYPFAVCMVTLLPLVSARYWRRRLRRRIFHICAGVYAAGVFVFCLTYLTFCIYLAAEQPDSPPPANEPVVLLVFGGGVRKDAPSPELKERLDLAASLLYKNDSAVCIVSGGSSPHNRTPEAMVMYSYLTNNGIPSERILLETMASDTKQNILFSMELLESGGLQNRKIVCVSSDYHIPRIRLLCKKYGLEAVYAASAPQNPLRRIPSSVREYMAYIKMLLKELF